MPTIRTQSKSIYVVGGDDEFSIKERTAKLAEKLTPKNAGDFGLEIIEGTAANQDEALKILILLDEALDTVGFFGVEKVVWLKNTNLLADSPSTRAEATKDALARLNDRLKRGLPDGVLLLISAIGFDRRKSINKTLEKQGEVVLCEAIKEGKNDDGQIVMFIQSRLKRDEKSMTPETLEEFRVLVAAEYRELANELEKLIVYVGERKAIGVEDVHAVCSATHTAVIWELTDAIGTRRLPEAIRILENLLDTGDSPIGILMMLVAQFRLILLVKDLIERKLLTVRGGSGGSLEFVKNFERLPEDSTSHFPRTKEGARPNAWRLYRCALAAKNFSTTELIRAMDLLLEANRRLVSTQLDECLVLEQAIVKICTAS